MITEDFVSFETAKLLKEKGFDCSCEHQYINCSSGHPFLTDIRDDDGCYYKNSEIGEDEYSVPTLQMAMKWLREKHNLFIGIHPRLSFTDYYWITADIYRVRKKGSLYHVEDVDDYNCVASCDGTSFEDACESAIKYCLEKLI